MDTSKKIILLSDYIEQKVRKEQELEYYTKELDVLQKKMFFLRKEIQLTNFIIEIGSNDGAFIKNFDIKKIICVEPCNNVAKITQKIGYKTFINFWNMKLAKKIKSKVKNIDLIYSANTLSHIQNLNSVFNSIVHVLSDDGVLIIEDPSLLECFKQVSYDQFYNEHIYIFSLLSIKYLLKKHNLEVFNIKKNI